MATNSTSEDNPINLIFIGETGVGKTSLAELFINYGLQKDKRFDVHDINEFIEPRKRKDKMESDTSEAATYNIKMNEFELNIIDTPGLVDSRGEHAMKRNIEKIITAVQNLDYVNCICLIFNGTISRITPLIEFVIQEIQKLIPSEVLNNVIVIFTKTSDALALNFELDSLVPYNLEVVPEHSFMLENPFCRWQKAKKLGILEGESVALEEAFIDSYKILEKITMTARYFEPVAAKKFGELHKVIGELEQDIIHLRLTVLNTVIHKKTVDEVKSHLATKEALKEAHSQLEQAEETIMKSSVESNIICLTCSKNCHLQCNCKFTGGLFGNVRACRNFKKATCQVCNHSSAVHLKSKHNFVTVKITNFQHPMKLLSMNEEIKEQRLKLEQNEEEYEENKQEVEEKLTKLFADLKDFQRIGSNSLLILVTEKEIERLKRLLKEIPEYKEEKARVVQMFDETIKIGKNPFSVDDGMKDMLLIWACGMLGVHPNNLRQNYVDAKFKQMVTSTIRQKEEQYKYYEHAKKVLDDELEEL